jgi:hypothetical protein
MDKKTSRSLIAELAALGQSVRLPSDVTEFLPNLSEEDWDKITRYSKLPPEAREEILGAVAIYRIGKRVLRTGAAKTRTILDRVASFAKRLEKQLTELIELPAARVYLTLGMVPKEEYQMAMSEGRARARLAKQSAELRNLVQWMEAACASIKGSRRGAHDASALVKLLVLELDRILSRHTGRHIIRTTKRGDTSREFITTVCKIADPDIGNGAIDEAMKTVIKARSRKP